MAAAVTQVPQHQQPTLVVIHAPLTLALTLAPTHVVAKIHALPTHVLIHAQLAILAQLQTLAQLAPSKSYLVTSPPILL